MKTRNNGEVVEVLDVGLGENPAFADWVRERVAADEVSGAIRNLVQGFVAEREDGEAFREFVAGRDEETLAELLEPEETSYDPVMHNTKNTWHPYAEDDAMDDSPAPTSPGDAPASGDD